jgi:hypothetical protein
MTEEQSTIDPFHEMNRYDERDEDWPSAAVFEEPRRTLHNYWKKFHAARDCGCDRVRFIEETTSRPVGDKYEYRLYCSSCGYQIPEEEVLFIGGDWYSEHDWQHFGRPLDDLHIPEERVVELGPDPGREDLEYVLNLGRIEREGKGLMGFSFGNGTWYECDECGHETPLTYDGKCRMHYDGEWTERMQGDVEALGIAVRERNSSFVHRLEKHVDPLSIKGRAFEDMILWRRHEAENVPQLVEVKQCLRDDSDGHWEYVLTDMTHTSEWRYHEDDLADCFWDTGLYNRDEPKPVMDDRIREVFQRVCDHSFHTVHDSETHEPAGEQCIHCRKRRNNPKKSDT